jgi:hypothetical protein
MIFVLLLIFALYLLLSKERYTSSDPFLDGIKDRFIDPQNHRYINQIDYYRDAPNIDLEREFRKSSCEITKDWSKMTDYEYVKAIQCLQGSSDRPRIKSINAI